MKGILNFITSSIKRKLIISTTTVIIITIIIIGYFSVVQITRTIKSDVEKFSVQILNQANLNLNRYFTGYEQGFLIMGTSKEFENWVKVDGEQVLDMVNAFRPLENNYIRPFVARHSEILSVTVLNENGNEMHYTGSIGLDKDYSFKKDIGKYENLSYDGFIVKVEKTDRYLDTNSKKTNLVVISMIKSFFNKRGYIKIDISLNPTDEILNKIYMGNGGNVLLADCEGKIITKKSKNSVDQLNEDIVEKINAKTSGSFFNKVDNDLVVFDTLPYTGWKTIAILPYKYFAQSIFHLTKSISIILIFSIILSVILIVIIASSITNRVEILRSLIRDVEKEKINPIVEIRGNDEIAELSKSYNKMISNLNESVYKLTESTVLEEKAVLSALQSQINSHFLYNTLESINSMASLVGQVDIERVTIALSRMLRYTSNYKQAKVKIIDEINHLVNYMVITQIRFGKVITYSINVDEKCENISSLKVIIQPLVENCIKHGVEFNGEDMHIDISVEELNNEYIKITVKDNGTGFEKDKLKELQKKLALNEVQSGYNKFCHIGLLNVHYRLRMFYKTNTAGVFVRNQEDVSGAVVEIVFPKVL